RDAAVARDQRSGGARAECDRGAPEFREEVGVSAGDVIGDADAGRAGDGVLCHAGVPGWAAADPPRDSGDGVLAVGGDRAADSVDARIVLVSGGAGGVCAGPRAGDWVRFDALVFHDADLLSGGLAAGCGAGDSEEKSAVRDCGSVPRRVARRAGSGLRAAVEIVGVIDRGFSDRARMVL